MYYSKTEAGSQHHKGLVSIRNGCKEVEVVSHKKVFRGPVTCSQSMEEDVVGSEHWEVIIGPVLGGTLD